MEQGDIAWMRAQGMARACTAMDIQEGDTCHGLGHGRCIDECTGMVWACTAVDEGVRVHEMLMRFR